MKCTIPEISWHNRDPVLSVDIQHNSKDGIQRLATAGTDTHVLIWSIKTSENEASVVEFLSDLARHQRAVNVVRFSPNGETLASGDDEAVILLWNKKSDKDAPDLFTKDSDVENKETWNVLRILRGHIEDVYDLAWASNSIGLISGSVDNTAIIWDTSKGQKLSLLSEHKGFVQGVAWDPRGQYAATLSTDRSCRIFNLQSKRVVHKISKATLPIASSDDSAPEERLVRLYHDDTLKTFCRRLCFSPDGELLFTPCGVIEKEGECSSKGINVTYVFSRNSLSKPVAYYPTQDKPTLVVRCCPVLFQLRKGVVSLFDLPYRIVFAVATQSSVLFYDTQQTIPFARVTNIHYTRLTDLTWSQDGRIIVVSSTDGYCSLVNFDEGELGAPYENPNMLAATVETSATTLLDQSSTAMEAAASAAHMAQKEEASNTDLPQDFQGLLQGKIKTNGTKTVEEEKLTEDGNLSKKPRRLNFITLSGPKKESRSVAEIELTNDAMDVDTLPEAADSILSEADAIKLQYEDSQMTLYRNTEQTDKVEDVLEKDSAEPSQVEEALPAVEERLNPDLPPTTPVPIASPQCTKNPRRVPLITLSSPKQRKLP